MSFPTTSCSTHKLPRQLYAIVCQAHRPHNRTTHTAIDPKDRQESLEWLELHVYEFAPNIHTLCYIAKRIGLCVFSAAANRERHASSLPAILLCRLPLLLVPHATPDKLVAAP